MQQRFHRQQPLVTDVHMRADRQQALGHRPVAVLQRTLDQGFFGQQRLQLAPQRDAFEQRAALVHARQAVAQRGVHVEVGVDEWGAQQPAFGVDLGGAGGRLWQRAGKPDGGDAALLDEQFDAGAAVGEGGVADQHGR